MRVSKERGRGTESSIVSVAMMIECSSFEEGDGWILRWLFLCCENVSD